MGKLPVPGRPTIWITVGQWSTARVCCCAGLQINIKTFRVEFFRLTSAKPVKISDRGVFYGVCVLASVIYDGKS